MIQFSLPTSRTLWIDYMHRSQDLYPAVSIYKDKKILRNIDFSTFLRTPTIGVTRFELAASTSLTWRATSCATPRSLYLASVSQQTQALLYKSATGKARGIFRYSANTQTNAQTRSGLQRLLRPIMHLGFAFPAFTDAFRGSTCISELIFQHIRITFPSQMHPCQAFSANQDHFPLANASLNRLSCKSGSFPA